MRMQLTANVIVSVCTPWFLNCVVAIRPAYVSNFCHRALHAALSDFSLASNKYTSFTSSLSRTIIHPRGPPVVMALLGPALIPPAGGKAKGGGGVGDKVPNPMPRNPRGPPWRGRPNPPRTKTFLLWRPNPSILYRSGANQLLLTNAIMLCHQRSGSLNPQPCDEWTVYTGSRVRRDFIAPALESRAVLVRRCPGCAGNTCRHVHARSPGRAT